ncbi:MAG TPA: hypothetical protein VLJ76_06620 [Gaiellaceae bacterium]|nr:hypothetical protein [Gaiellaceae bacterium]
MSKPAPTHSRNPQLWLLLALLAIGVAAVAWLVVALLAKDVL